MYGGLQQTEELARQAAIDLWNERSPEGPIAIIQEPAADCDKQRLLAQPAQAQQTTAGVKPTSSHPASCMNMTGHLTVDVNSSWSSAYRHAPSCSVIAMCIGDVFRELAAMPLATMRV